MSDAINKTQCPSCFAVHQITIEQYRKSGGKVRCGECRQRFIVEFLTDDELAQSQPALTGGTLFSDIDFDFDKSKPENLFISIMCSTITLLLIAVLCFLLAFQLWFRQQVDFSSFHYVEPYFLQFAERLKIEIPEKKDLANLDLLTARIERHPENDSIMLAKVKLLNNSKIAQPFPWLELVLNDQEGRMVARKALAPEGYLHNNQTSLSLQSKELKTFSIELAAFPDQVHGYELRLLNK